MAKTSLNLFFRAALVWLLLSLAPYPNVFADQANVFIYHRFSDSRYPSTSISGEDFLAHLQLLRQENFSVLTLGEVVNRLQRGTPLPERCAVITIDDAYQTFFSDAWPILKEFGFPATVFVNTDKVGARDFIDWQGIRDLLGQGGEIGNHSAAHDYMLDRSPGETAEAWRARMIDDLQRSQQAFKKHLGITPDLFAYPYGEFSSDLALLVKEAGFTAAVGQQSGVITSGLDFYQLPRFPMGGGQSSLEDFRSKLFMRPLRVQVDSPQDTVIKTKKMPVLKFYINIEELNEKTLRCYTVGGLECTVRPTERPGFYEAESTYPMESRRAKYTLTVSDHDGQWRWFSQLWVMPNH